jgi:type I restriction enzyme S subunit
MVIPPIFSNHCPFFSFRVALTFAEMKWSMVNLPEVCRPRQWKTLSKKEMAPAGYPVYGANGRIGFSETFTHEKPVILIGCRGTCGSVHVTEPKSYANGNAMALDDLDESRVNLQFLTSVLKGADFSKVITGVAQPQITGQSLSRFQIPLPPLAEQKRIAAILDAADALRTKRREALAQLDVLLQSTFLTLFGDPVANPMGLSKKTLETAFQFTTGKLDSNAANEGGEYPFFTCARETFAIDEYAFDCEALLLAGNNANADYSVKHYKGKFNAYQRTYVITVDETILTYEYARFALEYMLGDLKRFSKGTNTKYLTMVILNRMPILVPSLDEQRGFAAIVESVERQKAAQRTHLAELDALFAALQHRAFRGEL